MAHGVGADNPTESDRLAFVSLVSGVAGERSRDEPDKDPHHGDTLAVDGRLPGHLAVLEHEHADRFDFRPTHFGDRNHRCAVSSFVRFSVYTRRIGVRGKRIE